MADWSRVVNTTTKNYVKGEEVNVLRERKLTALLKMKGRITYNWGGDTMVWRVRYRRAPLQGFADTEVLVFPRRDKWKTAELPWRGYASTDSMTKGERLKNKSTEQIVNIYDSIVTTTMEDVTENFCDEMYVDGNAAGNLKKIHGIESFMGTSGVTLQYVASPSDSYAGLNTDLGSYGGSWTGTWPSGKGDSHYDFWSPTVVNYSNAVWSEGTTFAANCMRTIRYGINKSQKNKSQKGRLDVIFLENDMYQNFQMKTDAFYRINANKEASQLTKLGYGDTMNYDGIDITWEFGTPTGVGYGFNIDQMELRSQQGQLFVPEGPDYDIGSKSWRLSVDFYGNLVMNPRYAVKWVAAG